MIVVYCDICSLGVDVAYVYAHASKHLKEAEIEYAKTGQTPFSAPIKFNESIVIPDPFIAGGQK